MKYNLIFERFLNPERVSMPDFDTDFSPERRGEVMEYVMEKYGADHVAQIVTFGTMAARGAIRDVGRAHELLLRGDGRGGQAGAHHAAPPDAGGGYEAFRPKLQGDGTTATSGSKTLIDTAMRSGGNAPEHLHPRRRRGHHGAAGQ